MLLLIRDHEVAIGCDDVGGFDAEAGRPPSVEVPAQTAIQQKAAQGNRRAVSDGKGQPVRDELPVESLPCAVMRKNRIFLFSRVIAN